MVAARVLAPQAKLGTARWWRSTTLAADFGVTDADEDELYAAMDWVLERQGAIQKKLAKRHLKNGAMALFDLSSSYSGPVRSGLEAVREQCVLFQCHARYDIEISVEQEQVRATVVRQHSAPEAQRPGIARDMGWHDWRPSLGGIQACMVGNDEQAAVELPEVVGGPQVVSAKAISRSAAT